MAARKRKAAKRGVSWAQLRKIALALPRVVEGSSYGTPAFRVGKKFFARLREDGETLALKVPEPLRDALLEADGKRVFFTTDHYEGHPFVLVSLPKVAAADLEKVLEEGWRELAPRTVVAKFDAD